MPNFICTTCGTQFAETDQSPSAASSSETPSSASQTTATARCFVASQRAALIEMNLASCANAVQDPVVKSCKRVPMATTTSAFSARAFALVDPMIPIGPA